MIAQTKFEILKSAVVRLVNRGAVESAIHLDDCSRCVDVADFIYANTEDGRYTMTLSQVEYLLHVDRMTSKIERFFIDACTDRGMFVCRAGTSHTSDYIFARPKGQIFIPAGE